MIQGIVHFTNICLTRQSLDEYSNRFYYHALVQKMLYLVYSFGILLQVFALNLSESAKSTVEILITIVLKYCQLLQILIHNWKIANELI